MGTLCLPMMTLYQTLTLLSAVVLWIPFCPPQDELSCRDMRYSFSVLHSVESTLSSAKVSKDGKRVITAKKLDVPTRTCAVYNDPVPLEEQALVRGQLNLFFSISISISTCCLSSSNSPFVIEGVLVSICSKNELLATCSSVASIQMPASAQPIT